MSKNVTIGLLVIVIALGGYLILRAVSSKPTPPPQALSQEVIFACGNCGHVVRTTEGEAMKMKRAEDGQCQCPECGEWQLRAGFECPGCHQIVPVPSLEWMSLPPNEKPAYKCPKCGAALPGFM